MPLPLRIVLAACYWLLLCPPATALELPPDYRGKATDLAFAALLSMPGAEPAEGRWIIPRPADFEPVDEPALIAYLQHQLDQGAELDARRHFGTLLQHALRARLGRTAIWLLEQGARPRPAEGDDALTLAHRYGMDEVAQLLIERHGFMAPPVPNLPASPTPPSIHLELAYHGADSDRLQAARERQLAELRAEGWARLTSPGRSHDLTALVAISAGDPAQLDELLALLPEDPPDALKDVLFFGMRRAAESAAGPAPTALRAPPIDSWRRLWDYLGIPVDYATSTNASFGRVLASFPQAHLDELLASGYAALGFEQALGCQLSQWTAQQLETHWPVLARHFPDLAQRAPAAVLDHYRLGANCWSWDRRETLGKLQLLQRLGATGPVTGLSPMALADLNTPLREAIEAFRAPPKEQQPRLTAVTPQCRPRYSDALYRHLLQMRGLGGDASVAVEVLQWIAVAGRETCALWISGSVQSEISNGEYDSFHGPYRMTLPPCLVPDGHAELWWEDEQGQMQKIQADTNGLVFALQEVEDGEDRQRYYLSRAMDTGRCSSRLPLPIVLDWVVDEEEPRLAPVTLQPEHREILIEYCGEGGCADFEEWQVEDPGTSAFSPVGLATLMARWPADGVEGETSLRQQYLDAVMALDRATLRKLKARGVPADWTREAIHAVTDSGRPLDEKRRRIAWLFHDPDQLAAALDSWLVERLRGWLPLEDWGPVLRQIEASPLLFGESLVRVESQAKLSPLDCALQHAQQQLCGGGWLTD